MRLTNIFTMSLALTAAPVIAKAPAAPPAIAAAVASPDRSPDNVKLDESRKPAEVLQFLGLKPGMRVARSVRRQFLLGGDHRRRRSGRTAT